MAQLVKNPLAMQETWVHSLGWEDPLEKGMETHSIFLPGEFHRQRGEVDYSPWGCKELDTSKQLTLSLSFPTGVPTSFFVVVGFLFCFVL